MENLQSNAKQFLTLFKQQMAHSIVGQERLIEDILIAYIAAGHVLLEGVPGLAKTLTVRTFAELSGLQFKRIQFTPDLLPADLTGTLIFEPNTYQFSVRKGPVFANIILADEINRSPAKVQSALLEAMAEGQVTIGETSYTLPQPFFVLATQNPIEQEGTYLLPEAELDRFLFKLFVPYPSINDEITIMMKSSAITTAYKNKQPIASPVISIDILAGLRKIVDAVQCCEEIQRYIVSLVAATRPLAEKQSEVYRGSYLSYITVGASPRASIALYKTVKIRAFLHERTYVLPEDVKAMAYPVLRHRLKLSYEAVADGVNADEIIKKLLETIPQP
ncbi:MAG: AAA family ATPase [Treponema sp.]